jgi:hypothetical protein
VALAAAGRLDEARDQRRLLVAAIGRVPASRTLFNNTCLDILVDEAAAAYRADPGLDDTLPRASQHPRNVWSLHGYHECFVRLGRTEQARIIRQQLDLAAARADVAINASCACRLTSQG